MATATELRRVQNIQQARRLAQTQIARQQAEVKQIEQASKEYVQQTSTSDKEIKQWEAAQQWIRRGKPLYAARSNPELYRKIMKLKELGVDSWEKVAETRDYINRLQMQEAKPVEVKTITGDPPITKQPYVVTKAPSKVEQLKRTARVYYGRLFEDKEKYRASGITSAEDLYLKPLTAKKVTADVGDVIVKGAGGGYGAITGKGTEWTLTELGVSTCEKEIKYNELASTKRETISTYGPLKDYKTPKIERTTKIEISPKTIGKVVGGTVTAGTYYLAPSEVLAFGGAASYFGPKEPYRTPEVRKQALATGLFGVIASEIKYVSYLKTPQVTKYTKPIAKEPWYFEVSKPVKVGDKVVKEGKYMITQTILPAKMEITTPLRQVLGMKPSLEYGPIDYVKTYKTWTPFGAREGQGFITLTKKVGSKYANIEWIRGESAPTTKEAFAKLSKVEKYQWQKLVEKEVGKPVSLDYVPKMIKESSKLSKGYIEVEKLGRYYEGGKFSLIGRTPGKTTTRFQSISIIDDITPKDVGFQVSRVRIGLKEVTFPGARASGNIPTIRGKTIQLPMEDVGGLPSDILSFKGGGKSTLQFIGEVKTIPKIIPKIPKTPKIKLPKPTTTKPINLLGMGLPKIVGGEGTESIYAGTGEYELTGTTGGLLIKETPKPISKEFQTLEFKQPTTEIQQLKPINLGKSIDIPKPITKTQPIEMLKQQQVELLKQKQVQQLQQKQIQRQIQRQIKRGRQPTKNPFKPRIRIPIPKSGRGALKKLSATEKRELFTALIRRRGKWLELGKTSTIEEAVKLGKKGTLSTLGASFKITQQGKPITELKGLDIRFRKSKREKGVFIQKRRFRLSTFGERKEIKLAKRRSKFFK